MLVAIAALVVALVVNGMNNARDNASPNTPGQSTPATSAGGETTGAGESPSPTTSAPAIVSAKDFDPEADNGNHEENPGTVANVIDGDPATSWTTLRYRNRPNLGGLKPGVGVVLDLGEKRTVTSAELILTGGATAVELRVPTGDTASMRTEEDWEIVASNKEATGTVALTPEKPVETQYLLVYFTSLPKIADGYKAG